ncbi:hypothetical protein [Streptomyces sp. NPDC001750]|uniref:hypothetical protein n=1 Tax=Streptomyces sp. NPDC001750 TaxID=3364607 RepID=UPI0036896CF6
MADDLYTRYQHAHSAWRTHRETCPACQANQPCAAGQPIHDRFVRLQDAYIARQQNRR